MPNNIKYARILALADSRLITKKLASPLGEPVMRSLSGVKVLRALFMARPDFVSTLQPDVKNSYVKKSRGWASNFLSALGKKS